MFQDFCGRGALGWVELPEASKQLDELLSHQGVFVADNLFMQKLEELFDRLFGDRPVIEGALLGEHEVEQTSERPDVAFIIVNRLTSRFWRAPLLEAGVAVDNVRFLKVDCYVEVDNCELGFALVVSDDNIVWLEVSVTDISFMNSVDRYNKLSR